MSDTKVTYKDAEQAILKGIVAGTTAAADLVHYWNACGLKLQVGEAEKERDQKLNLEKHLS